MFFYMAIDFMFAKFLNLINMIMKKLFVCVLVAAVATGVFAQEQGKVRGGLDIGGAIPSKGGGGVAINVPLGYNLQDNMNVGMRVGIAAMAKIDWVGEEAEASANLNFLGTFHYYFNKGTSPFAPFVGGGVGFYTLGNANTASEEVYLGNKFGGMLTGGAEIGKFRIALEYNFVPSSEATVSLSGSNNKISA